MQLKRSTSRVALAALAALMLSGTSLSAREATQPVQINSFSGAFLAARVAEVDNDLDDAIAYYKRALGFAPDNPSMQQSLMLALISKKQVAVLVPTTVLAAQHFSVFRERYAGFAPNIQVISRFQSNEEIKKTLAGLKDGTVDIVIGTHRLLSKDVLFHDLGLLVVDEEHRFGVAHKERLKKYRAHVHVLSMSATPNPSAYTSLPPCTTPTLAPGIRASAVYEPISLLMRSPSGAPLMRPLCASRSTGVHRGACR